MLPPPVRDCTALSRCARKIVLLFISVMPCTSATASAVIKMCGAHVRLLRAARLRAQHSLRTYRDGGQGGAALRHGCSPVFVRIFQLHEHRWDPLLGLHACRVSRVVSVRVRRRGKHIERQHSHLLAPVSPRIQRALSALFCLHVRTRKSGARRMEQRGKRPPTAGT